MSTIANLKATIAEFSTKIKAYVDDQISGMSTAISGKANANHSHVINDVSGLAAALASNGANVRMGVYLGLPDKEYVDLSFTTPFPNKCDGVFLSPFTVASTYSADEAASYRLLVSRPSITKDGFRVINDHATKVGNFFYVAFGS